MNILAEATPSITKILRDWIDELLKKSGMSDDLLSWSSDLIMFISVLILAMIMYFIVKKIILNFVKSLVQKTKNDWDDELLTSRIFSWVAAIVPVVIIWKGGQEAFTTSAPKVALGIFGEVSIIILAFCAINSILNVCERIYRRYEVSKKFPVKSFIQVAKIIMLICAVIFIISSIVGKSPVTIFAGLGAMTAVLMLIFKDSILGLVAGVQLSANRMVARGDWIEMPKFGADGEVLEVALTTVKVRNWDKTITTLPTYALISDSFKNWRGMSTSGVRRIKRSVNLDMRSVKFVDEAMMTKFKGIKLLEKYLADKETELDSWNAERGVTETDVANARVLTNVGTFRAYVAAYLNSHPKISKNETLLVRQLQPSQYGLPIEVYVFTSDNRWVEFEGIQGDIFDHLLAVLPEFGLEVYQRPSGADFSELS